MGVWVTGARGRGRHRATGCRETRGWSRRVSGEIRMMDGREGGGSVSLSTKEGRGIVKADSPLEAGFIEDKGAAE